MKRFILITGLLVALSGLIRSVDAQTTSIVGYGSDSSNRIHLINLETATLISSFDVGVALQGLAIDSDPSGDTLYGSDQNGVIYRIDPNAATPTAVNIGNPGLGGFEAMDFNFNGTELWITDFNTSPAKIYKISRFDTAGPGSPITLADAVLVQTLDPQPLSGSVRTMTSDTTDNVWIVNDGIPVMDFQSVSTAKDINGNPVSPNVTPIGSLDDNTNPFDFFPPNPSIRGMDRGVNGVLYGLSNEGGAYIIDQEPSVPNGGVLDETTTPRLTPVVGTGIIVDATGSPIKWLALAISTDSSEGSGNGNGSQNAVGELEIGRENNCQNDNIGQRVARELELETYNTDPELLNIWNTLFGVDPETSPDDKLTLLGPNRTITWEAGRLEMGGLMRLKVKTDCRNPALKIVKITKAGKHQSPTLFISGTGGVNPNLADGGWHEVEIKKLDNVTVTFDGYTITGFLQKLEVELDENSTTAAPVVDEFRLKIKGVTSAPNGCSTVSSVVIDAPQTVVTVIAGAEYEEDVNESPEVLTGHTEAEFEREPGTSTEGVDISSLLDGNNDRLKEREGPCVIEDAVPAP